MANSPWEEDGDDGGGYARRGAAGEDRLWSPPQFTLRTMLIVGVCFSVFCALLEILGTRAFFPLLILCLSGWFAVCCWRLFHLSTHKLHDASGPGRLAQSETSPEPSETPETTPESAESGGGEFADS